MRIETKFSPGNTVFSVSRESEKVWVTCSFCGGKGQITGADKVERSCPECYNRKGEYEYQPLAWQILSDGSLTIGQVRVEITDTMTTGDPDTNFDNYKPKKGRKETYMCVETGVGSGSVHDAEHLFATSEEAQADADRRNKGATDEAVGD